MKNKIDLKTEAFSIKSISTLICPKCGIKAKWVYDEQIKTWFLDWKCPKCGEKVVEFEVS